ncbi:MAG: molecular chaperone HtpG [Geminicoccaceae bacterium]|jgi:molecular chaperone HtpG|nr:molecular chaperone HtpG [Geminicoccaceae bacterium]
MSDTVQPFEAEVGRVLDLVINSLYKEREIFLRELVSNASDACDKLRYASLSQPELLGTDTDLKIEIFADPDAALLTIRDNGIGMDRDELVANLGTIARSGTARFLEAAEQQKNGDVKLIGQFGVGFYAAFMVADRVVVQSRKAGEETSWLWVSDGRQGFTVSEAPETGPRGVTVTLHLKEDAREFLGEWRLREIIRRYSDHIAFPILLQVKPKADDKEAEAEPKAPEKVNEGGALWTRPRGEITDEQYKEFYHHVAHAFDDPFARVHFTAEGQLSYTALLFVPSMRPFDLYDPKRRHGVKLYVKRVFITDDVEALMPRYLRFVAGVLDSEDLQLNVSRETLQHGAIVQKMRKVLVRRVLDELAKKAKEDGYEAFWADFGPVLKEGLFEDHENRERLLEIARFRSTEGKGWTTLDGYVERMKEGQADIFYITGTSIEALRSSPQLEMARAKGVEVLLFDDPVDEFWLPEVGEYKGKKLHSLTRSDVDLSSIKGADSPETPRADQAGLDKLIARLKLALGEQVKDVRASKRLKESAVCLVADDGGMDLRLGRMLKGHEQFAGGTKPILEINAEHALVGRLRQMVDDPTATPDLDELAFLLLDQARIIEGEPVPDPGAFSRRMSRYLARGIEAA